MEKQAKIIIKTEKTEMSEADFDTVKNILEKAIMSEALGTGGIQKLFSELDGEVDVSEIITEGSIDLSPNGGVIIRYEETELSGMEGCTTKIMFNIKKPEFVVMMRDGGINTSLSFEPGRRHVSTYQTPYMPFRICVNTVRVENTFLENGEILIEYLIEVRGLSTDRNVLKIKANFCN